MTQEEKKLLVKDLSARLPYGVKVRIKGDYFYDEIEPYDAILKSEVLGHLIADVYSVKPYLRPMSSMTEEEHNEWFNHYHKIELEEVDKSQDYFKAAMMGDMAKYDWLNERHFDYRDLITKGLALEAPKGMYNYED